MGRLFSSEWLSVEDLAVLVLLMLGQFDRHRDGVYAEALARHVTEEAERLGKRVHPKRYALALQQLRRDGYLSTTGRTAGTRYVRVLDSVGSSGHVR